MTNLKECSPKLDDQTRIFLYPQLHVTRVPKMDQEYNYIILVTHEAKRAAFKFILMTASISCISNHRSTPYRNCLKIFEYHMLLSWITRKAQTVRNMKCYKISWSIHLLVSLFILLHRATNIISYLILHTCKWSPVFVCLISYKG